MKKVARKIGILVVGIPVTIIGLILIPVPGPGGIPVTLLGLFILAQEFESAAHYREKFQNKIKEILNQAKEKSDYRNLKK